MRNVLADFKTRLANSVTCFPRFFLRVSSVQVVFFTAQA